MKRNIIYMIFCSFLLVNCSSNNSEVQTADKIIGTWVLIGYENNSTDKILAAPDSSDQIVISFMRSEFEGNTGRNTFFGDYTTKSTELIFLEFATTEVAESDWGSKFANAIVSAYEGTHQIYKMEFLVKKDTLQINFGEAQVMLFKKP